MKLEDIKDKIDRFFDNISPEDLYNMAVNKYGFKDITYDLVNEGFQTLDVSNYGDKEEPQYQVDENNQKAIGNLVIAA